MGKQLGGAMKGKHFSLDNLISTWQLMFLVLWTESEVTEQLALGDHCKWR